MRIGFIGNTNNYPFALARALRRLGHDVLVVIDRPEPLHRPESRYDDVLQPYPEWIVEVAPFEYTDVAFCTPRWRAALDAVRHCDALVLNSYAFDAASRLRIPSLCLTTGSDIDWWSNPRAMETIAQDAARHPRDRRWVRAALGLPAFDAGSLDGVFERAPAPFYHVWSRYRIRRMIECQRRGLRRAVAISTFPEGVVQVSDEVVRECLAPGAHRLLAPIADTSLVSASPQPNNRVLRLFNGARVLWQLPFPPGVGHWENKGTDVLIRGVAAWHARTGRAIDLQMVEKGPSVAATKALIRALSIESLVTWRPEMSQREVYAEYRRADVVVDQLGTHAVGMTAYDAMSAARPVLANGRPEEFGPAFGMPLPVAQARTPGDVADQLERLTDPDTRRSLGEQGRRFAESRISADRMASTVALIFQDALDREAHACRRRSRNADGRASGAGANASC